MRTQVRVELSVSWPQARRHLPRALYHRLAPFLVERALAEFWAAAFVFDAGDAPLAALLAHAAARQLQPGLLGRSAGHRQPPRPLLRRVRRWPVYEYAELADEPVVQLIVERQVDLSGALRQYYRAELACDAGCGGCGSIRLVQQADLRLVGDPRAGAACCPRPLPQAAGWQADDLLAVTSNHELVLAGELHHRWVEAGQARFRPVTVAGGGEVWQALPHGLAEISPLTPFYPVARCAACGRPTLVARYPPAPADDVTRYEDEPALHIRRPLPDGDYWETAGQVGRVRWERVVLERFATDPEPFYVRTAAPFRLLSQRWLRALHASQPIGGRLGLPGPWRCRPICWAKDTPLALIRED